MDRPRKKRPHKKKREFKPAILNTLFLILLFFFLTNWMPEPDPFYTFFSLILIGIFTSALIVALVGRMEGWYPYLFLGSMVLCGVFCLFAGLKAAKGVPVLQALLIILNAGAFIFGFWAEKFFPALKQKDWKTTYFLILIAIFIPALFILEMTMGDTVRHVPSIMKEIFGEESGIRILTYLLGFGMSLVFIFLTQSLYWNVMKDKPVQTAAGKKARR